MTGQRAGGKPVNLVQLQGELVVAGVQRDALGLFEDYVHIYDAQGQPADFPEAEQPIVDATIAAHAALRDKTDEEYAAEFQGPNTTPERRQEIRDITAGLLPREQVLA
jgi:hypothetical protein